MKFFYSILIGLILVFEFTISGISADFSHQNVEFNHITIQDGLANNRVDCMIQDHQGYMWVGTKRGLCRYNGYEFKTYRSIINDSTSLRYNQISTLLESSNGTLWVGTWSGGLHKYDRKNDNFIRVNIGTNKYNDINVTTIFEDSNGRIWVAFTDRLFLLNEESNGNIAIVEVTSPDGKNPLALVSSIYEDNSGRVFIAVTNSHSLITYLPETNKTTELNYNSTSEGLPDKINQFYPIDAKNLWIAASNGLFNFNLDTKRINLVKYGNAPAIETNLNFIVPAVDDNLWIGGEAFCLYDKKKGKFEYFTNEAGNPNSISGNMITCGLQDNQNNFWFGTFNSGINVIYNKTKYFNRNHELVGKLNKISKNITAICENADEFLFLGTWDKGLIIFNKNHQLVNSETEFPGLKHLKDKTIRTITCDKNGIIWIGSEHCVLTRFNITNKQVKIYQIQHPLAKNKYITKILITEQNNIWIGTDFSLFTFNLTNESFTEYKNSPSSNVLDLEEDNNGNIWCASYNEELCRINKDKSITYFNSKNNKGNLPDKRIVTIYKDSKNKIWIGTEFSGLFLYEPESNQFEQFTVNNGLPSNELCSIQEDSKGRLWIGTNNGLSRFNYSLRDFKNFFRNDGMDGDEFHYNANFTSDSGELYFGCTNGIVIFNPDEIRGNYLNFPIKLEQVTVNNGLVLKDIQGISIGEALRMNKPFELKYNQNSLSFKYTSLNYSLAKKSNFAYQLIGLENNYNYVQNQRQVTYTNLNPGKYTFRVIASNNDDVWDEKGTEILFIIKNPPWLMWWAFIIYGILFLIALYAFRHLIRHEEKMKNEIKLERIEKNQQTELNQMKLQFFTNISHEFKTPLTLIIGPLDQIITELHGNSGLKTKLSNISNNSKRLLELINQLIDFRKMEQDMLPLNKSRNNLIETTQKMMNSFKYIAIKNEIQFVLNTDFESLIFNYDSDKVEKILTNILSNAFKYTSLGGNITIHILNSNETTVCISISDTGSGIVPNTIARIFEKSNSISKNIFEMKSSGIGLAYSKKLVELHRGSLQIESEPNKGTSVTIELPFDRDLIPITIETEQINKKVIIDFSEDTASETAFTKSEIENIVDLTTAPHILVVEDDEELRKYIVSILIDRFQIDEAEDGQIGFDLALKNDYDLIVSDIMMPNMSGTQLCEKLKSNIKTSHILIILLTAKTDINSKNEGYETGADSYITKPFLPKHLIQVIKNLLNTRQHIKDYYSSAEEKNHEPLGIHPRDKQFIADVIRIIEKNIDEEHFGVEVLGKELRLSRTHLFRKFKSLAGTAPNDYIRQIRLKKAAQLIKEGNYSISEIAYMVGFKTPANFSTSFKAFFGKSPKEYHK